MVRPGRFELPTLWLVALRPILSSFLLVGFFAPTLKAVDRHIAEPVGQYDPLCVIRVSRAEPESSVMKLLRTVDIADAARQPNAIDLRNILTGNESGYLLVESKIHSRIWENHFSLV